MFDLNMFELFGVKNALLFFNMSKAIRCHVNHETSSVHSGNSIGIRKLFVSLIHPIVY